jgi:hypothetical protein
VRGFFGFWGRARVGSKWIDTAKGHSLVPLIPDRLMVFVISANGRADRGPYTLILRIILSKNHILVTRLFQAAGWLSY